MACVHIFQLWPAREETVRDRGLWKSLAALRGHQHHDKRQHHRFGFCCHNWFINANKLNIMPGRHDPWPKHNITTEIQTKTHWSSQTWSTRTRSHPPDGRCHATQGKWSDNKHAMQGAGKERGVHVFWKIVLPNSRSPSNANTELHDFRPRLFQNVQHIRYPKKTRFLRIRLPNKMFGNFLRLFGDIWCVKNK